MPAAYFAVDTFFWIGGFLITLGMLEQLKRVKSFGKFYFGAILHRFIRIWPTYMVAILIFWKIAPFLGSGPIWSNFYKLSCSCNDGGVLWNMFFIDNFGDHGPNGMDYCFGWVLQRLFRDGISPWTSSCSSSRPSSSTPTAGTKKWDGWSPVHSSSPQCSRPSSRSWSTSGATRSTIPTFRRSPISWISSTTSPGSGPRPT